MMRYSSSLPLGWCYSAWYATKDESTKVDFVSIAVATSWHAPSVRFLRLILYAITLPPSTGCFQSRNTQASPCFGDSSCLVWPGEAEEKRIQAGPVRWPRCNSTNVELRGDLRAPQVAKSSPMPALSRAGLRSASTQAQSQNRPPTSLL